MINPQNQRIMKIVELFEQMNLFSPEEMTMIEDYLTGNGNQEEIERLPFRDRSVVPGSLAARMKALGEELMNRGREEDAGRLGEILFTVGQSTCFQMMPMSNHYILEKNRIMVEQPAKKVAVYAAMIGRDEYQVNRHMLSGLIKTAENRSEIIREAIEYEKNKFVNGKIILYTAYFRTKYRNIPLTREAAEGGQTGITKGADGLPEQSLQICAEDAELLKAYGEALAHSLPNLYRNQMPRLEMSEIMNAVQRDQVDARILKMAGRNGSVDRFMLRLLGGTAFVNYAQSPVLRNVLKICLAANTNVMLDIMESIDLRGELGERGGEFDRIFGIDAGKYIAWAAVKAKTGILRGQFKQNREEFLNCMKKADFDTFQRMNGVIGELDPGLYRERSEEFGQRQQSMLIEAMVQIAESQAAGAVREYLKGEKGIETLYPYEENMQGSNFWGGRHWAVLQSYQRTYGFDALSGRCEAYLMLYRGYVNSNILRNDGKIEKAGVKRLFAAVNAEHLGLRQQLNGYADIYDSFYSEQWKADFQEVAKKVFGGYLEERPEEMTAAFREAGSTGRCLGLLVLGEQPDRFRESILGFSQDTSKAVREELLKVLGRQKNWEEDVLKLLGSKKAAERETAVRVLADWGREKYAAVLAESLEKEKNGKVRSLLEKVLQVSGETGENAAGKVLPREELVKEIHKGGRKRTLAWAYETPFSAVHMISGEEASEEYLQAVFLSYASMSPCGVSSGAALLAEALDQREFAVYANELFDKWMEAGAESKKRWVLYAASIHGGAEIVKKLQHQIQEWPQAARGAIASEAVQALALNPQPQALLIVDGISRKFKFKQVKTAAGKALDFAASQLGITTEELADRIVPDLGFNEKMERIFDYGERKFTVTITTALEIEVFDESGKKLKNLPSPGKRDDQEKAAEAYEEFKQMKKQMKATVSSQKMRLEMALSSGRQWSVTAWKNLFVKNPVMHQFATGLIWGVYEDRKLVSTFRYMEDGSFNTEEEDEFQLPDARDGAAGESPSAIGLVHPIELSGDSLKTWKEQLEDYEIVQPVEQLERPVYHRTEEEGEQKSLERFGGCIVNDLSLGGKLQALGWYRGSVQDGGGFYSYYREDRELGLGVELHFSGSFVGGENEDVTVYEARFYNAGGTLLSENSGVMNSDIRRGSYVYDEANDSNSYFLKEVQERYFSEIVLQLTRARAASKEKNANWKTKR